MCGISGAYWSKQRPADADRVVDRMIDAIGHRGPDSDGRSQASEWDVAFKRLAIIDLSGGEQPLASEDGMIECFLNGEIYNYLTLRRELSARGHRFKTTSDTEVLPHLYEDFGVGMFGRLNGMFTIVVIDHRRRELIVARDHVGVKQMYYAETPSGVAFSSEVKGLLASGLLTPEVDPTGLLAYLTLFYCPEPRTLIRGVMKLPPASFIRLTPAGLEGPTKYWELEVQRTPASSSEAAAAEATLQHLESAVGLQLQADVPVGLSLSGGIDSSAIALAASLAKQGDLMAFTVAFDETPPEEMQCATEVATHLGIRHEVLRPSVARITEELPLLAWISDEPIADPATYSQFCIARAAREHVTVLLSGTGGDEVFAGYNRYFLSPKRALFQQAPAFVQHALSRLGRLAGADTELLEALQGPRSSRLLLHCLMTSSLDREQRARLGGALGQTRDPYVNFRRLFDRYGRAEPVAQQSAVDLQTYLSDQLLPMLDRATMAASIEGRVPFLDVGLIEFAMSLPDRIKVGRPPRAKRLLKAAIRHGVPPSVIERRKLGMPSPIFDLLAQKREQVFRPVLCAPDSFAGSLLPRDWLASLIATDESARANFRVLYSLLVLEIWHRLFIRERIYSRPDMTLGELCRVPSRR
jgi:asparagine synthase (glutamine-hydrolysing)